MSHDELTKILRLIPDLEPNTLRHYQAAIDRWCLFAGGQVWTPRLAQAFYNDLLETQKLKPQSANVIVTALRTITKQQAAFDQDPRLEIFRGIRLRKETEPEQAMVLTEEQAEFLAKTRAGTSPIHLRDFAIVILGLQTGMRRMSFVGASIDRLSFADATMVVPVKGGSQFKVPLSRAAMSALQPWVKWLASRGVRRGPLFQAISMPRLETKDVEIHPITIRGFDAVVARMASDASERARSTLPKAQAKLVAVDDLTPHTFRHTFVTWCRLKDVPPHQIAAVTGHVLERSVGGSSGMIADVYTRREMAGAAAAEAIALPWMFR